MQNVLYEPRSSIIPRYLTRDHLQLGSFSATEILGTRLTPTLFSTKPSIFNYSANLICGLLVKTRTAAPATSVYYST